jgi:hypothetical protein
MTQELGDTLAGGPIGTLHTRYYAPAVKSFLIEKG